MDFGRDREELAGNIRAEGKTKAKHHLAKAKKPRPLLIPAQIGDNCIGCRDVDSRNAGDQIADKERNRRKKYDAEAGAKVADRVAEIGEEQHFFPTDLIGKMAKDGRCKDLGQRIGREEKAKEDVPQLQRSRGCKKGVRCV